MPTGIAFTRARDNAGTGCLLYVYIDGELVDGVPYRGRREFVLRPGVYSIQIGMDWCFSPPYEVEVREGEMVEVEGGLRWRGLFLLFGIVAGLVAPRRAYVVRPAPAVSPSRVRRVVAELWEEKAGYLGLGIVLFAIWCCAKLLFLLLGW